MMKNLNGIRRGMLVVLGAVVGLSACKKDDNTTTPGGNNTVNDFLTTSTNYTILKAAVDKAGWQDSLRNGSFTLFAPTDSAFLRMGVTSSSGFSNYSADSVRRLLRYHILTTRYPATAFSTTANTEYTTLGGSRVYITRTSGGQVYVNGNRVVRTDSVANGIIHGINGVLAYPRGNLSQVLAADTTYSFLRTALMRADSSGTGALSMALKGNSPYTIFAPTNAAFRAAGYNTIGAINAADRTTLGQILAYHAVQGRYFTNDFTNGTLTTVGGSTFNVGVNGSSIGLTGTGNTSATQLSGSGTLANNGLIYSVNQLLLPGTR
jgi:uncharacterized surface protein with fasciclin (FAS1) repeats